MDPEATWDLLIDALNAGDADSVAACCTDLDHWLSKGGFMPPNAPNGLTREGLTYLLLLLHGGA